MLRLGLGDIDVKIYIFIYMYVYKMGNFDEMLNALLNGTYQPFTSSDFLSSFSHTLPLLRFRIFAELM